MADRMNRGAGVAETQRREEPRGVLQSVAETAQEAASNVASVASNVASAAGDAWDSASRGTQQAVRTVENAWGDLRACMGRYPFATFFFGMGFGALAALALERRWAHGRHD